MRHPDQAILALHAGGDLGWFTAWRTSRHVARCGQCRDEVAAFQNVRDMLPELNEMPDIPWNRIASEMRANIRLGLAAGECVRETAHEERQAPLFAGMRAAIAMASVLALLVTGLVLERPTPSVMGGSSTPVIQATADGIQTSVVDPQTGIVTVTKVYVQ